MATNIYLLGAGILGPLQITEETKQALQASKDIYVLHPDTELITYLEHEFTANVHDVADLYGSYINRKDVYTKISELLVNKAKEGSKVSFIVHGHPLFLVSASEYTLSLANQHNLTTRILPAVSSFDTLMCDLKLDYGYALQMFDSTTLLNNRWSLNPSIPLLIFQLSTTNNKKIINHETDTRILEPLTEHLIKFYPPDHEVKIVHSATQILEETQILSIEIQSLTTKKISLNNRPTLYVPPTL